MRFAGVRWIRAAGCAGTLAVISVTMAAAQSPSDADRTYVRTAIETNDAEIAAAHLALRRSNSDDVKHFAERMIHDHTMLNEQMRPLAAKLDVEVAHGQVTAEQQQVADQLKELTGNAFDQQYIGAMVRGHQKAVNETRQEADTSQFPPVKNAAGKALPIIQHHLQLAQNLAQAHHVQTGKP
jgi:putative membrane protein